MCVCVGGGGGGGRETITTCFVNSSFTSNKENGVEALTCSHGIADLFLSTNKLYKFAYQH